MNLLAVAAATARAVMRRRSLGGRKSDSCPHGCAGPPGAVAFGALRFAANGGLVRVETLAVGLLSINDPGDAHVEMASVRGPIAGGSNYRRECV
jgi:hypothetical protein